MTSISQNKHQSFWLWVMRLTGVDYFSTLNFVLFGDGNIPWLVRELLHKAELNEAKRPRVVIG